MRDALQAILDSDKENYCKILSMFYLNMNQIQLYWLNDQINGCVIGYLNLIHIKPQTLFIAYTKQSSIIRNIELVNESASSNS